MMIFTKFCGCLNLILLLVLLTNAFHSVNSQPSHTRSVSPAANPNLKIPIISQKQASCYEAMKADIGWYNGIIAYRMNNSYTFSSRAKRAEGSGAEGDVHTLTAYKGLSEADTIENYRKEGPLNLNVADVVSVIAIEEINRIYKDKQLSTFRKFIAKIPTSEDDHPDSKYEFTLFISQPSFVFKHDENKLGMVFRLGPGSVYKWQKGWNPNLTGRYNLEGSVIVSKTSLSLISGTVKGTVVAIKVAEADFSIALDVKKVKIYNQVELKYALDKYFHKTFVDSDFPLGVVIANPDEKISDSLHPKSFRMKMFRSSHSPLSGTGFLGIFIMTSTNRKLKDEELKLPNKFDLIPNGFTSALIISNKLLYEKVLPESLESPYFSFSPKARTDSGKFCQIYEPVLERTATPLKGVTYATCDCGFGYGHPRRTFHTAYGPDSGGEQTVLDFSFRRKGDNSFVMSLVTEFDVGDCIVNTWGVYDQKKECKITKDMAKVNYTNTLTLDLSNEKVTLGGSDLNVDTIKKPAYKVRSDMYPDIVQNTGRHFYYQVHDSTKGKSWYREAYMFTSPRAGFGGTLSKDVQSKWVPKLTLSGLNTYLLNRIIYPGGSIYDLKRLTMSSQDLVLWGNTKTNT
eukprot:Nk52_evm30s2118 gene=Nk52_evmTU30s2118